jgi:hypothetical protein
VERASTRTDIELIRRAPYIHHSSFITNEHRTTANRPHDHSRHALLKNLYAVDLVRDGERWVMLRVHIDNVWFTGDPTVIIGA